MNAIHNKQNLFFIEGLAGQLEMMASYPDRNKSITSVVIICHPHPQYQGTMHNKVVTTVHKAFYEQSMATIRFNYRGVGHSEGDYGNKQGEIEDLFSVIAWIKQKFPQVKLYLAGFSFGAYIAYKVTVDSEYASQIMGLTLIAPPVVYFEFNDLPEPQCPWIVAQGEQDEVFDANTVFAWVKQKKQSPIVLRFHDASHFFHGKLITLKSELQAAIESFK